MITGARALAGVPIAAAYLTGQNELAFMFFAVAASSDALDGPLARRLGVAGGRGTFLDPLADKVLVVSTLAMLAAVGVAPVWLFLLVTGREAVVGALRASAFAAGESWPAGPFAKTKTVCEMLGTGALLASPALAIPGYALLLASLALGVAILPAYLAHQRRRFT